MLCSIVLTVVSVVLVVAIRYETAAGLAAGRIVTVVTVSDVLAQAGHIVGIGAFAIGCYIVIEVAGTGRWPASTGALVDECDDIS